MSWIKENYEKAAVGGAVLIALGIGAVVLLGGDEDAKGKAYTGEPNNDASVAASAELNKALAVRSGRIEINEKIDKVDGRKLNLFVGQLIYAQRDGKDSVDLYSTEAEVHPGIPNKWWLEYGLDPSFANAPARDPDGDGFSNLEEAEGGTSPIDKADHPLAISKLEVDSVESFRYRLRWSEFANPQITMRYVDVTGKRLSMQLQPGDVFFDEEPMKGRFKLGERKQVQDDRGMQQEAYEMTDLSPLKKGRVLTLFKRGLVDGQNEFADYSANLRLNALGQQDKPFKLEEGESFSLPFDPNAAEKPYSLKSIKPDGDNSFKLEIEYEVDGKKEIKELKAQGK